MNLNQVTISSLNVEKSLRFYKILGLKLIVDALPRYVRFECPTGEATFSIHRVDKLAHGHKRTLYVEVQNLSITISKLKEKGIIFKTAIFKQLWLWEEVHLADPNNNTIIIYHAGINRKNPPRRLQ